MRRHKKSKYARLIPHPQSSDIARSMQKCVSLAIAWAGPIFRSVSLEYANSTDLLSGIGSKTFGARFTPKGGFPSVYGSLDPETAMAEALALHRRAGIPIEQAMPRVFVSIRVRVQRTLDLTDGHIRSVLRKSHQRLTEEPWQEMQNRGGEALTQAVGRVARELGLEGLLVPSAQRAGKNVVLFSDKLLTGSRLRIINAGKLRRR
jgi:RES domain-containing protein